MDELFITRQEYLAEHHPEYTLVRLTVHDITWLNEVLGDSVSLLDTAKLYNSTYSREIVKELVTDSDISKFNMYITMLNNYLTEISNYQYVDTPMLDDTEWLNLPDSFSCIETYLSTDIGNTLIITMEYTNDNAHSRFSN